MDSLEQVKQNQRVRNLIFTNKKLAKMIQMNKTKIRYKSDLELKRFKEMIDKTVDKLNSFYETAQAEMVGSVKRKMLEFEALEDQCVSRDANLQKLIIDPDRNERPQFDFMAEWSRITSELEPLESQINSLSCLDVVTSTELSSLCVQLQGMPQPFYVHASSFHSTPSRAAKLTLIPFVTSKDTTTITVVIQPSHYDPCLRDMLSATLEKLVQTGPEDAKQQFSTRGVVSAVHEINKSVRICFPDVRRGADYVINVFLCGKQVEDSPMRIRIPEAPGIVEVSRVPNADKTALVRWSSTPCLSGTTNKAPNFGNAISSASTSSTRVAYPITPLSILASRARHNSGGVTMSKDGVTVRVRHHTSGAAVAVAPKFRPRVSAKDTAPKVEKRKIGETVV